MRIGAHQLRNALFVAPMAGITDRPFRRLARRYGAALAVSEMLSSRPELRESRKTRLRADHAGEPGPISVQIAGSDPALLAEAARHNVERGADIIDINMGCPAKKVCNVAAGSAQCLAHRAHRRIGGRAAAFDSRPHARLHVRGMRRVRDHLRGEILAAHPGGRQRRRPHARGRKARARADGGRRHHGGTRGAGKAVAVPGNFALPRDGRAAGAAACHGDGRDPDRASRGAVHALRVGAGGPGGAQAHRLDGARAARWGGTALRGEQDRCRGGAVRSSERLFRETRRMKRSNELSDCVKRSLERYFKDMDGEKPTSIYEMVLKNIEKPMIETVLGKAAGNLSLASQMLGVTRNTLRKKMQQLRIKG